MDRYQKILPAARLMRGPSQMCGLADFSLPCYINWVCPCSLLTHLLISPPLIPSNFSLVIFNQDHAHSLSPTTMVRQTWPKNKIAHPTAPVMSKAAKVKAGIIPAKPRSKRMMKDARIQELEAQIAQFENPNDPHPSKEPSVCASPLSHVCIA